MKKISIFTLLLAFVVVSCSKNEEITPEEDNALKIGFKSEKETAVIFELVNFYFVSERDFYLSELRQTYDSLVWSVEGIRGT